METGSHMPWSYLAWWVVGVNAGAVAGLLVLRARHVLGWRPFFAGVLAVVGLIVGAKLQYRVERLPVGEALSLAPSGLLDAGVRLPLGLLLGGILAGLGCLAWRAPWRETGDALAVGAPVMVAIGRLGCLWSGCCMGTVCRRWSLPFLCVRHAPGTEAFSRQLRDGLLSPAAEASLPAHPLPVYFALGALAILVVLVRQLRRGAAPGTMLLTACMLASLGKLLLETLRAEPRPPGLMTAVPAATLAVATAIAAGVALRRATRRSHPGRATPVASAAAMGVLALAAWLPVRPADASSVEDAASGASGGSSSRDADVFAGYVRDPSRHRRALLRLGRDGTAGLAPLVVLAMADARLRAGQRRAAALLFSEVLERRPGEPMRSWARFGMAWCALLGDDEAGARALLADVALGGGPTGPAARLLAAVIDASERRPDAVATFERIAAESGDAAGVGTAARFGAAWARYALDDFDGATAAFDAVAAEPDAAGLTDDARYAAAWSGLRAGRRTAGEAALAALAGEDEGAPRTPVDEALVNLEARALLHRSFRHYRRGPVGTPEGLIRGVLDGDGHALARMALRYLHDSSRAAVSRPGGVAPAEAAPPARVRASSPPDGRAQDAEAVPVPGRARRFTAYAGLALTGASIAAACRARIRSRAVPPRSRA